MIQSVALMLVSRNLNSVLFTNKKLIRCGIKSFLFFRAVDLEFDLSSSFYSLGCVLGGKESKKSAADLYMYEF